MITYIRTNSSNSDFQNLVNQLDAVLKEHDGDDHAFFAQFNKIDNIQHIVVAYANDLAVGCGAIKEYTSNCMEVKRMYVTEAQRGKGIAKLILAALEKWAKEFGYNLCILETDKKLSSAIALYTKCGYTIIPNYDQYIGVKTSICFEKKLL
jgi:putative acetyltransferase